MISSSSPVDEQEKEGVDCKDCQEVPGEVGGSPGGRRGRGADVEQPGALTLGDQAEKKGGGGGQRRGKKETSHREDEAGEDCDVEEGGGGREESCLKEESQAGCKEGKVTREGEGGVEGDRGEKP